MKPKPWPHFATCALARLARAHAQARVSLPSHHSSLTSSTLTHLSLMKLWAVYALLAITANHALGIDKLTGVQPQLISKYAPSKGEKRQWTCLDGSKTIPWSAVNNDYCDCPGDGSDEPGVFLNNLI